MAAALLFVAGKEVGNHEAIHAYFLTSGQPRCPDTGARMYWSARLHTGHRTAKKRAEICSRREGRRTGWPEENQQAARVPEGKGESAVLSWEKGGVVYWSCACLALSFGPRFHVIWRPRVTGYTLGFAPWRMAER